MNRFRKGPKSRFNCAYIGRTGKDGSKPFRFILNHSKAIVSNSYLILYPKPHLEKELEHSPELSERVLDEGRVYGGGMHKMEPRELANVPAMEISRLFDGGLSKLQLDIFAA